MQRHKTSTFSDKKISSLVNSIFYFLNYVIIIHETHGFRLIAIHGNEKKVDQVYPTLRGAKIAFSKMFKINKANKISGEDKSVWTPFYHPESLFIDGLLKSPYIPLYTLKQKSKKLRKKIESEIESHTSISISLDNDGILLPLVINS